MSGNGAGKVWEQIKHIFQNLLVYVVIITSSTIQSILWFMAGTLILKVLDFTIREDANQFSIVNKVYITARIIVAVLTILYFLIQSLLNISWQIRYDIQKYRGWIGKELEK
ncbi:MAG: hypothetical protein D6681_11145 [Calditrichaeota bacterium]|nr:MAG: hypothetical protein D6681_11145 [Calditrichota bacterium]